MSKYFVKLPDLGLGKHKYHPEPFYRYTEYREWCNTNMTRKEWHMYSKWGVGTGIMFPTHEDALAFKLVFNL